MTHDAAYYREKAAHCRRLAQITTDETLITELQRFATEFDTAAEHPEARVGNSKTAP